MEQNGIDARQQKQLSENYHLKTVIDIRTNMEREEKPDCEISGIHYLYVPLFDEAMIGISHESATDRSEIQSMPDMRKLYRMLVADVRCVRQIRKVMDIILFPECEGAVLWHCTEGKDRCGLISALFLMIKGLDYDTILQDYLKTNEVNASKAEQYYAYILANENNCHFQLFAAVYAVTSNGKQNQPQNDIGWKIEISE